MKVSVIGTGYVGLVSGVCLAEKGHDVVCVDIDQKKVDQINQGVPPIHEAGIESLLKNNLHTRFLATTDLDSAVLETEISLIAVGTPIDGDQIDLKYIMSASRQIGAVVRNKSTFHTVVVKSTVVPGTTANVVRPTLEQASGKQAGKDFGVGMNPEFLREGQAVEDFMFPDRIVLGTADSHSLRNLEQLYAPFENVDKIRTNLSTAEMIKYTSNSLLATMISFSNEIANLCSACGDIDVTEVMKGVHMDKRICPILSNGKRLIPSFTAYIEAGCGFGGSCFPKDVKALIAHGEKVGSPMRLLDAVIQVNQNQPRRIISLLKKHFSPLSGIRVSVLGIAFKPGTDDIRESPAIPIIEELLAANAIVKAYDPIAGKEARKIFDQKKLEFPKHLDEAIHEVDAVVLITRWDEFSALPQLLAQYTNPPVVIDGRRMLDKRAVKKYEGIGL
jgi:UDPglucose 6-dehydrogenase/GDP-mannose 6-dehydrogenase